MKSLFTFLLVFGLIQLGGAKFHHIDNVVTGSGKASWYGADWHGKKTATGAIYDMHSLTAAHKTLPFGTKVKVTNQKNGKSVVVEVNNRGPYIKGRIFDLSKAAFAEIADLNTGVISIDYEILN